MPGVSHFPLTESVWRVARPEDTVHIERLIMQGMWGSLNIQTVQSREAGTHFALLPFLSLFRPWAWFCEDVGGPHLSLMRKSESTPRFTQIRGGECSVQYLSNNEWCDTWFDESGSFRFRFIIPTRTSTTIP